MFSRAAAYRDVCGNSSLIGLRPADLTGRGTGVSLPPGHSWDSEMHKLILRVATWPFLAGLAGSAFAQTVTIDLSFSDKALAELTARGEGVVIATYWMGDPVPGATIKTNEIGTVFLMSEDLTLHPGPVRLVVGSNLSMGPMDQVTVPYMNVNVFSARWTDEDNLLDCDFLDDTVAKLAAAPQAINCKLIGE
jgi:hypothetical protein